MTAPQFALDYTGARFDFAAMKAAGVTGVIRYTKYISPREAQAIREADLQLALVEETTATMTSGGAAAGHARGRHANDIANQIGFPADRPIFYAVDHDVTNPSEYDVIEAFLAAAESEGRVSEVYGEADVVDAMYARGASLRPWQCYAWSRHRLSPHAVLFQRLDNPLGPVGTGTDVNNILAADWGQWGYHPDNPPPADHPEDDEMMTMAHTGDKPPKGALPNAYYSCVGLERSHLSPGAYYALSALKVPDFGLNDVWVAIHPQDVAPTVMPDGT